MSRELSKKVLSFVKMVDERFVTASRLLQVERNELARIIVDIRKLEDLDTYKGWNDCEQEWQNIPVWNEDDDEIFIGGCESHEPHEHKSIEPHEACRGSVIEYESGITDSVKELLDYQDRESR